MVHCVAQVISNTLLSMLLLCSIIRDSPTPERETEKSKHKYVDAKVKRDCCISHIYQFYYLRVKLYVIQFTPKFISTIA